MILTKEMMDFKLLIESLHEGDGPNVISDFLDTVADLERRLAQAEEQIEVKRKSYEAMAASEFELRQKLIQAEEQAKLEVTARLKEAAEIAHNQKNSDNRVIEEKILALIPSDNASLYERRMAERALTEAKWWQQSQDDMQHQGAHGQKAIVTEQILRIAELRRATAGKGQGE